MKVNLRLGSLVAAACFCASGGSAQTDAWKQLRFLIGTWDAKTVGGSAGAASSGTYSFQLELRDHILARHSSGAGCKGPASFDCEHGDLLYVYQDAAGQPYRAIYFDNEGHVIHYDVSAVTPASVVFLSEPGLGPRFRLMYELVAGVMTGKFQMQVPGQSDWRTYLEWSGKRT